MTCASLDTGMQAGWKAVAARSAQSPSGFWQSFCSVLAVDPINDGANVVRSEFNKKVVTYTFLVSGGVVAIQTIGALKSLESLVEVRFLRYIDQSSPLVKNGSSSCGDQWVFYCQMTSCGVPPTGLVKASFRCGAVSETHILPCRRDQILYQGGLGYD
jgi:hypothetical protein